jgi:hypothetical protein
MRSRIAAPLALSLAALCLAGCGSDDSRETSNSLMQRCGEGRAMTMTDPARDGLSPAGASAEKQRAVAASPDAFDLRRVSLKAGNGMLCVSATFAEDDPSGERVIGLNLATARLRLDPDSPLARLAYGKNENVANFAPFGAIESEPISGETTSGVRGRVVQLVVPLNQLIGISARVSILDPRSFSWRIGTTSDCTPGPRQLIVYPTGQKLALPASPTHAVTAVAPRGCRGS